MPTISRSWPRAARNTRRPIRPKPLIPTRVAMSPSPSCVRAASPEPGGRHSSFFEPVRLCSPRDPRRERELGLGWARRSAEIPLVVKTGRRRTDRFSAVLNRWVVALGVVLLAAGVGFWTSTSLSARPPAEANRGGAAEPLAFAGISQPVQIDRDRHGVPHIEASSEADAFFALGYCQAQDRLAQLLHLRRRAHGTAAEEVGSAALEADQLARLLDFR